MAYSARRRWGDNDKYFGPLTYARDGSYRPLAIALASGCDEYPGASLRFSGLGHTVILALPQWAIRPYREKVHAPSWDAATVKRMGRDWYWDIHRREYGFSLSEGFLSVHYGRQTLDSSTDKTWGYHLPWTQWRHVRQSWYGRDGEHIGTILQKDQANLPPLERWQERDRMEARAETVRFDFDDFDGERITVTTRIDEHEWRFGEGWFKWLSLFRAPRVSRSLDLRFSAETGDRKGSWKGGTIGHSITMLPGELHESAFRRYCDQNRMKFVGPALPHSNPNEGER